MSLEKIIFIDGLKTSVLGMPWAGHLGGLKYEKGVEAHGLGRCRDVKATWDIRVTGSLFRGHRSKG